MVSTGLIDWKTTTSRYSTEPEGLLSLDPQLICYSWISGISVLGSTGRLRQEACSRDSILKSYDLGRSSSVKSSGGLVETTIGQIEGAQFVSHTGIRFPQNGWPELPTSGTLPE